MNTVMDIRERFHVVESGVGQRPLLFAHGFGCDQSMWRLVAPRFEKDARVILFDLPGMGQAHKDTYDRARHSTLKGYAEDVIEIATALGLEKTVFVGHSVSAMIGVVAAIERPDLFDALVLVGPSPRYINDEDYVGGFSRADIESLIDLLDSNYLGWASAMAPVIMGNPDRPELADELKNAFCRTDPAVARAFARVTFLSDNRSDLPKVRTPALVIQSAEDVIAPPVVGEYVHAKLAKSELAVIGARGHCPQLSAPDETVAAIRTFLERI